jgi:hypothetical protein
MVGEHGRRLPVFTFSRVARISDIWMSPKVRSSWRLDGKSSSQRAHKAATTHAAQASNSALPYRFRRLTWSA